MNYIVDQPGFWSANDEDILQAIKKGFLECHMAMWKDLGKPASFVLNQVDEKIERDFSFRPVASLVSLGSRGSVGTFILIFLSTIFNLIMNFLNS